MYVPDTSFVAGELVNIGVYTNSSGPGNLLGEIGNAGMGGSGLAGWNSAPVLSPFQMTSGQIYWFGIASQNDFSLLRHTAGSCPTNPPDWSSRYKFTSPTTDLPTNPSGLGISSAFNGYFQIVGP